MKSFKSNFDYAKVLKYAALLFTFTAFNCLEKQIAPYSAAPFFATLAGGSSLITTPLLFLTSFLLCGEPGLIGAGGIISLIGVFVTLIYRKMNIKLKFQPVIFVFLAMVAYVFLGNTAKETLLEKRIFCTIITVALTFLCIIAYRAISEKGLKFKLGFEELCSVATVVAVLGLGTCSFISPYFWKSVCVLLILISCYVFRMGISTLISAVLGLSLAVYYGNIGFVSVFLIWNVFAESFAPLSRYASAAALTLSDYLVQLVFGIYYGYSTIDFISVLIGVFLFSAIPTFILKNLKEKLYSFREKQLVRQAINRNRIKLSGRLYDLSGVFNEMADAFNLFKKNGVNENSAKENIKKEIVRSVCSGCNNFEKCRSSDKKVFLGIDKMIDIGFAKGKLTLIDMPKETGEACAHPNNVLYGLNKMLNDYRTKLVESQSVSSGRDLIAAEARGVAEILRGLALESGTLLKYHNRLERLLTENLFKAGFIITELLIYGEEDRITVSIISAMKEFSLPEMQLVIENTLGINLQVCEKNLITDQKCYISFKKATEFDAVFGIAKAKKDGSNISGDTYSVTRINDDKFLVALSDGMGSGEQAETMSSTSLSLIESFYKAGLNGGLILNTVNKLLSINTEDCFTALDVSVIDLKTCDADFIKYGSPYGFIINDNGIKIVEGNTLPLGILDELKPSVASAKLESGDMILLVTDGISDAFGSSGDVIDFLRTVPAKNPQSLADDILERAILLNGGLKKDDMTALAVRIYKRTA